MRPKENKKTLLEDEVLGCAKRFLSKVNKNVANNAQPVCYERKHKIYIS